MTKVSENDEVPTDNKKVERGINSVLPHADLFRSTSKIKLYSCYILKVEQ